MTIIIKPYLPFWLSIPIAITAGCVFRDEVLDINIQDTYFVIKYLDLSILISICFFIIGLLYWLSAKFLLKLSNWLTISHIIITYGGFLFIGISYLFLNYQDQKTEFPLFDNTGKFNEIVTMASLIIIITQVLLPLNIIQSLFKK